jgi:hypothetical protein
MTDLVKHVAEVYVDKTRIMRTGVEQQRPPELAAGAELAPIPDDLAVDGIDEVLVCFLSFASHGWPQMFADHLAGCDGAAVSIEAGAGRWSVVLTESGVDVNTGVTGGAATVSGAPADVLLWAWRRAGDDTVRRDGDLALIDTLRTVLGNATM